MFLKPPSREQAQGKRRHLMTIGEREQKKKEKEKKQE